MAAHYGIAVLPTRPRRPRDKGKIEACALIVERWLIGACATDDSTASPSSTRDWRAAQAAQRGATDPDGLGDPAATPRRTRSAGAQALADPALCCRRWRVRRVGIHYHVDVESRIYSVPIAARAARSKCGSPAAPWRSSSRASGSPCTCDRAGTASTQLPPTTCPPVIAVTSTEPLAAFAGMLPSCGRSAISSSNGPTPNGAPDPGRVWNTGRRQFRSVQAEPK